jgi:hypothetical protein
MPTYYYPEGPIGPVCDLPGSIQGDFGNLDQDVIRELIDAGDNRLVTYGPIVFPDLDFNMGGPVTTILTRRCKVRELGDGTIEYYDCKDVFNNPDGGSPWPLGPGGYDWETISNNPWGLDDDFEDLTLTPEACLPHDPDINILPQRFYLADGSFVLKRLIEKSTPVTFPVNSGGESSSSAIDGAVFTSNGTTLTLESSGSGNANVGLTFKWDDNPNDAGTSLSGVNISGVSFNASGQKGETSGTIGITAGNNYPVSINPGTGYGGFVLKNGGKEVCFFDLDGDDCNANLIIEGAAAEDTVPNEPGFWSEEANKYAVWVNPELCTLPFLPQEVTYFVDIPATDDYTLVGGADDNFNVFLNDELSPAIGGAGGIFAGGALTTPYSTTRSLTAGVLKIVVKCTNSAAGFTDANGDPTGEAFSWDRNPGGWYLRLCRGGACTSASNVTWRNSGPHDAWSDFMNKYAMFASNNQTLSGLPQSSTWTVNIPAPGNYNLEVQADNTADISFDGTALGTVNSFTNSTNYTLASVSSGPHTITTVVTNLAPAAGTADQWATNPAGVAWKLTSTSASSITAKFNSDGDLVVDGVGTGEIELDFEWDDNPNDASQALGTVRWEVSAGSAPIEFTQTKGDSSGSDSETRTLYGGETYRIQTFNSTGGFEVKNSGQKLCFKDYDGDDCNAEVTIGSTNNSGPATIAVSSDVSATRVRSNMIWNTRDDVLYEYVPISGCVVQEASSDYGTGFFGYLLYNDGTVQQGNFITKLKPEFKLEPVFSGSGYQSNYSAIAATIFNSYLNTIGRFPEPTGFDGWINAFISNPMFTSLTVLTTAIYNSYITAPPNGSGEQALQTSRGGLTGNYDNCDTRRV